MPRPSTAFDAVAGVPLHYDRLPGQYGTRGQPREFYMTADFHARLEECFEDLWSVCPLGTAEVIATAGAYVEKPGAHGRGRGFDLDAMFWPEKTFVALHYPHDRRFYLGVEAVLRRHFGTVLNYEYNAAHHDHLHIDDLAPVGFVRTHRSRVLFVQVALREFFTRPVAVDGRWGAETAGGVASALDALDLAAVENPSDAGAVAEALADVWLDFLAAVADAGLEDAAVVAEPTPADLLRAVHAVLDRELPDAPERKKIEAALMAFAEHPEIAAVLEEEA